ncbi:MAG: hypothetical protein IJH34_17840 [Romboutsia sp.]|nr:hypothetical protein [Romboutsia sp.]
MMSMIEQLYYYIKNLDQDEDGFEEFEEFYEKVKKKEISFGIEDIEKICLIFNDKHSINVMEPHNYMALKRMTFITINKIGVEKGFDELIKGLIKIADNNPVESKGYMNMLLNGYSKDDITIFANLLQKYSEEDRKKIKSLVKKLTDYDYENYNDKGSIILNVV